MGRPTRATVLAKARRQIGVSEKPAGSNKTKFGAWFGMNGVAWCAIFQSWVFAHVVALPLIGGKEAYTPAFARWFDDQGRFGSRPRRGALVFYAWNGPEYQGRWRGICHVGIVEAVRGNRIVTIEGNVGSRVRRMVRSHAYVAGYGYPDYAPDDTNPRYVVTWCRADRDDLGRWRRRAILRGQTFLSERRGDDWFMAVHSRRKLGFRWFVHPMRAAGLDPNVIATDADASRLKAVVAKL